MTNIQIPSGLLDSNVEFFSHNGEPMATHEGKVKSLFELPSNILKAIQKDLDANYSVSIALELAGFKTSSEKLKKYTVCRFGNYDNDPDYKDGQLKTVEYFNCGHRGTCPMEGIVCDHLWVNERVISPFEISMIQQLATEKTIPVIAEELKVSINTLESRKKVLFDKLGVFSRARMVSRSYELRILNPSYVHCR
ncbi:LuxR C-terminal-related transcriptional regulator [Flavobacterium sediminilitoris]|uniref:LuxR C-terminal-related transcriptional regulator n=1 Tax=Flavobacterium sediminilitoris TaxID=2024526 RepID=A0ABY4HRP6_9FLAO|nr:MULTISPECIES: LuxR C-terminal-related transcriptional regulator [Flavobacterium]UOX35285.1 LuxR C-terminal-related transcriptional regulator [Flavobacterium sediminilitoris]